MSLHRTNCQWSVICVSETWLSRELESKRHLNGYLGFFDSRTDGVGGGVAVYVREDVVQIAEQLPKNICSTESLLIHCKLKNNFSFIVCQTYKPPSLNVNIFIEELSSVLESIEKMNKTAFICGDFNIDILSNRGIALDFFNVLASSSYLPLISKPTRVQEASSSLIDNIFCNNLDIIASNGIILDDTSDHFPIFATINIKTIPVERKRESLLKFDYHKIPDLNNYLMTSLAGFETVRDPETACDKLIHAYTSGIKKYSFQHTPNRKNSPIKPWISPSILASIDNRCRLFKAKQLVPSQENKNKYMNYRNILNTVIRNAKQHYIQNQLEASKHDARRMWETLITHTTGKAPQNKFPESFQHNNRCIKGNQEIAESFNNFFISIGMELQQDMEKCPEGDFSFLGDKCENPQSSMQLTNSAELRNIIQNMKNVGSGYDGINAKIFKLTFIPLLDSLVHFINLCLTHGKFPSKLKIAVVKPIYKSGDKTLFNNYRPISILPYISKILEKIVHCRIMEHIEANNIICPYQFGFRKGYSTYMPLLILQDKITTAFECQRLSCGVYLDLKKAFDTVDHEILLHKLQSYGITETFLSIIDSYLSNRYQCVEINNTKSSLKQISIGVPQGSILGTFSSHFFSFFLSMISLKSLQHLHHYFMQTIQLCYLKADLLMNYKICWMRNCQRYANGFKITNFH